MPRFARAHPQIPRTRALSYAPALAATRALILAREPTHAHAATLTRERRARAGPPSPGRRDSERASLGAVLARPLRTHDGWFDIILAGYQVGTLCP